MGPPNLPRLCLAATFIAALACGRTEFYPPIPEIIPAPVPVCSLTFSPSPVVFGPVSAGAVAPASLTVTDTGTGPCDLSGFTVGYDGGTAFEVAPTQPSTVTVQPAASTEVVLALSTNPFSTAGSVSAVLTFATTDRTQPEVHVPLTGTIFAGCGLAVSMSSIDFGLVSLYTNITKTVTVTSGGGAPCTLDAVTIGSGSDPFFSVTGPPLPVVLPVGQSYTAQVSFDAESTDAPTTHAGTLVFGSTMNPVTVPLAAQTPLGCYLVVQPNPLTFGNVAPNQQLDEQIKVTNIGTLPCQVSNLGLTTPTDPLFTLAPTPATQTVRPNEALNLYVTFDSSIDKPPYQHQGDLVFDSIDQNNTSVDVPLSGYVSDACAQSVQGVYTLDSDGTLSLFDPDSLSFTVLGSLNCQETTPPYQMAIDQNNVGWVEYQDGYFFQVQISDGNCTPTSYVADQQGFYLFGMGFVFDPTTGVDTLYAAGGPFGLTYSSTLASIAFPSLELTTIAPLSTWGLPSVTPGGAPPYAPPDLAGTGDGQLWGFGLGPSTTSGNTTLAQIDPANGDVLQSFSYPYLGTVGGQSSAMTFWGGSFWVFYADSIYEAPRDNASALSFAIGNTGHFVVGASTSTCAPVQ